MSAFQGHVRLDFIEHFQGIGDVGLGLALEKSLVAVLTEAGGGVYDELSVSAIGNAWIGSEIVGVSGFQSVGAWSGFTWIKIRSF